MSLQAVQQALEQKPQESREAHAAFLVFCALPELHRKATLVSELMGVSYHVTKTQRTKNHWNKRVVPIEKAGIAGEQEALFLFAERYHNLHNGYIQQEIRQYLRVPYPDAGLDVDHARKAREAEEARRKQEALEAEKKAKEQRLSNIFEQAEIQLEEKLLKKQKDVSISDLERIERMREREHQRRKEEQILSAAPRETVAQSDRVLRAKSRGEPILPALQEDMQELQLILDALTLQQQHPETFPLRIAG